MTSGFGWDWFVMPMEEYMKQRLLPKEDRYLELR
jgi:hypothetical protein